MRRLLLLLFALPALAGDPPKFLRERTPEIHRAPTNRYLVAFRAKPATAAATEQLMRFRTRMGKSAQPVAITREYHLAWSGVAVTAPSDAIAAIRKLDYVAGVFPDTEVQACLDKSAPLIGAPKFRAENGTRGAGVVVAVIDTGIDYTHPALAGKVIGGHDFFNDDEDAMDDAGHGTHVAGIIAAEGEVTGIAPDARLLAFKVLGASGGGRTSTVIAGIERALDPNADGDTSDAVDIVNLSLGSALGSPDDPASTAVDNLVAAGVVVCVAAGNRGDGFTIGSPAMARSAITVGATNDADGVTTFTSRGPNNDIYTIKPEVAAPGQSIRSTLPNNRYGDLSGTSMATPHVAGAAALLKSLHPSWTPADIKAALIHSAHAIAGEVMEVGAGRIDVAEAARVAVRAEPPALSYGLGDGVAEEWSTTQTIRLTNRSDAARSFTIGDITGLRPGITLTMTPATIDVPANGSAAAEIRLTVANAGVPYPRTTSMTYGGNVSLIAGNEALHIPWAFLKAARVVINDAENFTEGLVDDGATAWRMRPGLLPPRAEALLPAGTYDVAAFSGTSAGADDYGNPHLVVRERQNVEGTIAYDLTPADWPYTLRFRGVDEDGRALTDLPQNGNAGYASRVVVMLPGRSDPFLDSYVTPAQQLHTSAMSDRIAVLLGEFYNDTARNVAYVVQHPPVGAVTASRDLGTSPAMLTMQEAVAEAPPEIGDDAAILATFARYVQFPEGSGIEDVGLLISPTKERRSSTRLYLTRDIDARCGFSSDLMLFSESLGAPYDFITHPFRVAADGRVTNTIEPKPSPRNILTDPSRARRYGLAPFWPSLMSFITPNRALLFGEYQGAYGENRFRDWVEKQYRLIDDEGRVIVSGHGSAAINIATPGRYSIEATNDRYHVGDTHGHSTILATFDSRSGNTVLPMLTSLYLRDATGAVTFDLARNRTASLEFSAADYDYADTYVTYRRVDLARTRAWWRRAGETEWRALSLAAGEEEDGRSAEIGHWPTGVVWRANLAEVVAIAGAVDLRIALEDDGGNAMQWTMEPAFRIIDAGTRRRAVD